MIHIFLKKENVKHMSKSVTTYERWDEIKAKK